MGCGCMATQNTNNSIAYNRQPAEIISNEDCSFTGTILQNWYNILFCIKTNDKLNLINITEKDINSYLGYIQSAINYPDNYCYYITKLTEFQNNILPRIINNANECIN